MQRDKKKEMDIWREIKKIKDTEREIKRRKGERELNEKRRKKHNLTFYSFIWVFQNFNCVMDRKIFY